MLKNLLARAGVLLVSLQAAVAVSAAVSAGRRPADEALTLLGIDPVHFAEINTRATA